MGSWADARKQSVTGRYRTPAQLAHPTTYFSVRAEGGALQLTQSAPEERPMCLTTMRVFLTQSFAVAVVAAMPLALHAQAGLPPAKQLIEKFVAATNAVPVMAKHSNVRTKGKFEMAAAGVAGDLE